jgi:hypothetical protein
VLGLNLVIVSSVSLVTYLVLNAVGQPTVRPE